jgi:MSHA biogenesis protein MshI
VYAGERSVELASWLSREMGQTVSAMDLEALFPGLQSMAMADQIYCVPLLGVLLRTETRKL